MDNQTRVIIRVCVTDIPGDPLKRPWTLGRLFCDNVLQRHFQPSITSSGFDSLHIPPDFDSSQPIRRWFIYDLDVIRELKREELLQIPHLVYLATLQHDKW